MMISKALLNEFFSQRNYILLGSIAALVASYLSFAVLEDGMWFAIAYAGISFSSLMLYYLSVYLLQENRERFLVLRPLSRRGLLAFRVVGLLMQLTYLLVIFLLFYFISSALTDFSDSGSTIMLLVNSAQGIFLFGLYLMALIDMQCVIKEKTSAILSGLFGGLLGIIIAGFVIAVVNGMFGLVHLRNFLHDSFLSWQFIMLVVPAVVFFILVEHFLIHARDSFQDLEEV
jgi:hypothetical protein